MPGRSVLQRLAAVACIAIVCAGCSTTPSQTTTTTVVHPSTSTTELAPMPAPATTGVEALTPSTSPAFTTLLAQEYAKGEHLEVREVRGPLASTVLVAYDAPTKDFWAVANFLPRAGDPAAAVAQMRHSGDLGIYREHLGGHWHVAGDGERGACLVHDGVPAAVLDAWGNATPGCGEALHPVG